eukprot:TRINITY_DN2587_c0_g1_i1.p2 TRINITY_DN2587_c0_g1~~TRINITY_DN2587_c0_g1_i1.p2  ORF type:complete len:339 (+),score=49.48 TRINITY_DN2587_c0_g1_i1:37-1017(+)
MKDSDEKVIQTNDDASASKFSAVRLGYFADKFLKYFVPQPVRRMPLINRGYYTRVVALHSLIDQFLSLGVETKKRQIVILGAGFDTTFFQLQEKIQQQQLTVFEIDFPQVIATKTAIITRTKELSDLVGQIWPQETLTKLGLTGLHSNKLHLIPQDLRDTEQLSKVLIASGLDPTVPTLFLSECVLIYMTVETSNALVKWVGETFPTAVFIAYEQIKPNDPFGKIMLKNLAERGVSLKSIHAHPDLDAQKKRFTEFGWTSAGGVDMNFIEQWLPRSEIQRINRLEMFDEIEELLLMQGHYCIVWGVNEKAAAPGGIWNNFGFKKSS